MLVASAYGRYALAVRTGMDWRLRKRKEYSPTYGLGHIREPTNTRADLSYRSARRQQSRVAGVTLKLILIPAPRPLAQLVSCDASRGAGLRRRAVTAARDALHGFRGASIHVTDPARIGRPAAADWGTAEYCDIRPYVHGERRLLLDPKHVPSSQT